MHLKFGPRRHLIALLCLGVTISPLLADLTAGSSAIVSEASPLKANGQTISLEAGHAVTVLGLKSDTKEAVVSYVDATGKKTVGIIAQSALMAVDTGTPAPQANGAPAAAAPTGTGLPPLDVAKILPAVTIAEYFKTNRTQAKAYEGLRLKIAGTIDRVEVESVTGGGGTVPILTLSTKTGIPKVKVKLSNSLASGDAFFRKYANSLPGWWWGYRNRMIDFRLASPTTIEARAIYNYSASTTYSDGYAYTSHSKSKSSWFTIFSVGDPIEVEGHCKGLYMDVEFDGGLIVEGAK